MSDRFPNLGAMPSRQGHAPSTSTGAASAQAGMVRILRGSETRYVWPVHLPGWLAIGWQVGPGEGMAVVTRELATSGRDSVRAYSWNQRRSPWNSGGNRTHWAACARNIGTAAGSGDNHF